jgi:hypothetical protein
VRGLAAAPAGWLSSLWQRTVGHGGMIRKFFIGGKGLNPSLYFLDFHRVTFVDHPIDDGAFQKKISFGLKANRPCITSAVLLRKVFCQVVLVVRLPESAGRRQ